MYAECRIELHKIQMLITQMIESPFRHNSFDYYSFVFFFCCVVVALDLFLYANVCIVRVYVYFISAAMYFVVVLVVLYLSTSA